MTSLPKDALYVANYCGNDPADFFARFRKAVHETTETLRMESVQTLAELPSYFAKKATPHLLLLDWTSAAQKKTDAKQLEQSLRAVREIDPSLCVLLVIEGEPSAADLMKWLDVGATGLIHRDFDPTSLAEPLLEVLGRRLQNQIPRSPRIATSHQVELRIASIEQALVAETLNVGFGGLFVRALPTGAKVGDRVEFRLLISAEVAERPTNDLPALVRALDDHGAGSAHEPPSVEGTGHIVWIRSLPTAEGPEGIGIQFEDLNPRGVPALERFVTARRVRAFIPKA